jgi:hypothetical protein
MAPTDTRNSEASLNLSEEDLVGVGAGDVGGVEQGDGEGDGVADGRDHVGLGLGRAVEGGHARAAEALCGDLKPQRAQLHARHRHRSGGHGCGRQRLVFVLGLVVGAVCALEWVWSQSYHGNSNQSHKNLYFQKEFLSSK